MSKCECNNTRGVIVRGDYDWVLYKECNNCWKKENIHTWVIFDTWRQLFDYSPMYQFYKWELVWYSRYKAWWLNVNDDLSIWENLLWGNRGENWKKKVFFMPIKDLEIPHIRNILRDVKTIKPEYAEAMTKRLTEVINIKK